MAPKVASSRKAEEPKARSRSPKRKEESPAKEEAKAEEKYQEPDAKADSRPALKEKVQFHTSDTTLNVVQTLGGKLLTSLTEGGMSAFIAGARANVGVKSGRYMFEAKIVEALEQQQAGKNGKQLLKVGFSTSSASLLQEDEGVCFDNEGTFHAGKKKQQVKGGKFGKNQTIALVLNLDAKSPNNNTVALYRDGAAVADPIALPEDLQGKPLFPHVTFRNCTVATNFGPSAMKELSFKCRMVGGAAASDCSVTASKEPKNGMYDVVMPVAFPDEGTFDWLDTYLEQNPSYVELSDRSIEKWAKASGLFANGGKSQSADRPNLTFGLPGQDGNSLRKVLHSVAPLVPRNYVVMEVKSNLVAAERKEVLKRFNYPCFKKIAHVVMGAPNKEYKAAVQNKLLKEKQAKADIVWKRTKAERDRKKATEKKKKELEKLRKENEKKKLAEKKAKEAAEKGEEAAAEEEKAESEKEDEPMEEEPEETEPPAVELEDDEKEINFLPKAIPDLAPQVLAASFAKFSTPDDEEGFDDIKYEWQKGEKAAAYLKNWVQEKKMTTRVDNIQPGDDFKKKSAEFAKILKECEAKLKAHKSGGRKRKDSDMGDVDIFTASDVHDVGAGAPLYELFTFEDFMLMQMRFDFAALIWAFRKDTDDEDRTGIPMDHLAFYFNRYFKKPINPKNFGVADVPAMLAFIKDTVAIEDKLLTCKLQDDLDNFDIFVKLTEEGRRERSRRIEAGDETARLKFVQASAAKPAAPASGKVAPAAAAAAAGAKVTPAATGIAALKAGLAAKVAAAGATQAPKSAPKAAPVGLKTNPLGSTAAPKASVKLVQGTPAPKLSAASLGATQAPKAGGKSGGKGWGR